MLAANYDITLDRAAEYTFALTIQNQEGDAVNIGSATFYADVRNAVAKTRAATFTSTILDSGTNGQVTFSLTETQTTSLDPNVVYEYDIFMRKGSVTDRLLYGKVNVRPNITVGTPT